MIINTSYFGQIKKISNPVSISSSSPQWYTGPTYKPLAPDWWLVKAYKNGVLDEEAYKEVYFKQLSKLDMNKVLKEIQKLYPKENEITLLCYEKPDDFCHRHLVADWFNTQLHGVVERRFS